MSSIAQQPGLSLNSRRWLDRLLALEISLNAEVVAYVALVALAFALHFWNLGARALHHDESLHATYSYYLYNGSGYKHDPLMHGPVLFHLTALMYLLFGVSDATARFSAAFAGTALVFTPFFLRRWLGRWGALAACTMLIFSPTVLYYSRFIREDIFVALWTAGLFIGIWRYRRSGQTPWLYVAVGSLALGFANKEITFMLAAVVLIYADVLLSADLCGPLARRLAPASLPDWAGRALTFALLIPTAWAVAALWYPMKALRERLALRRLPRSGDILVVIGTLTLPQLAALVQVPLKHLHVDLTAQAGVYFGSPLTNEELLGGVTVILLIAASALAGLGWNARRWLISALVFYAIYVCLFTTFFTNPQGFASGIWGSLDYWLAQQDVQRGGQPVFYYLFMLPAYAYVSLAFALIGIVYQVIRRGLVPILLLVASIALLPAIAAVYAVHSTYAIPLVAASLSLAAAALRGNPLRQMLIVWFGGMLFGLSVAGEKMPWLTLHLEVPLILLAGLTINDLIKAALTSAAGQTRRLLLVPAALVLGVLIVIPTAWGPGSDGTHAVIIGLALIAAVLIGVGAGLRWSAGLGIATSCAMLLGLMAPLSLRTAFAVSYAHGDTPYEALVYTQTSPDIPKIMHDIDQYARESGQGYNLPIVVDANDAFSWPWAWYLRDYRNASFPDLSGYLSGQTGGYRPPPRSVLLVNDQDTAIVAQFPGQFGAGMPYHHRWWFPEDYRGTTSGSLLQSLALGTTWARWWGLIAAAHGIVTPPTPAAPGVHVIGSVDATAYFPLDYTPGTGITTEASRVPPPHTAPNGALVVGGPGSENGAFLRPAGLAVDSAGNFYVADSQNNRIEKFNAAGKLLASSNDASGPALLHEPWGVAVDKQGMVYVADTWNHRIVKMDAQLHIVTTWGQPTKSTGPDSLLSLYGPRSIAFDAAGNLLVTDTGNNRVIEFSPDGQPLRSFGSAGSGPGQLQEPVGLAVAPDGTIYVADTWNGRIDVFDAKMQYVRALPVSGWESHDIENKPYLALLPNGDILYTQPNSDRLVEISPNGESKRSTASLGPSLSLSRPIGIATDGAGTVYVSDGVNNQVIREPSTALP